MKFNRIPRLGFLGTGWIGRQRLEALAVAGFEIAAVCDPSDEMAVAALRSAPSAKRIERFKDMLESDLDGIVIATPSAAHAVQAILALEAGHAVFCQKPLGRTAAEVRQVITAAELNDRLLGVDFSYRYTAAMEQIRPLISRNEIGSVYAAEMIFHNAYGPDKPWFFNSELSGGGCVMDLGVHLVDLALWAQDFPVVSRTSSRLYAKGRLLTAEEINTQVEDYASAHLDLTTGGSIQIQCSWNLPIGADCQISARFFGTKGGLGFHNINGSFYDFVSERYFGTRHETLTTPPDAWPGRAAVEWAKQLTDAPHFDSRIQQALVVAGVLDAIYGRQTL